MKGGQITVREAEKDKKPSADAVFQAYFKEQIDIVQTPAPPSHLVSPVNETMPWIGIKRITAALVTAAAFTLFFLTAGAGTPLSEAVDTALEAYDLQSEITGFMIEAGEMYRSDLYGGNHQ